jgi:uncharacterized protein YdeI (BOF family)
MGAELGRISGPLLADNLVRHGIDLAFETDLLYLDVNSGRVGIQTSTPGRDLTINGKTLSTRLIVDTWFTVPDFYIATDEIQNSSGRIYIHPAQQSLDGILDGGLSGTISFVGDADGGSSGTLVFSSVVDAGSSYPYGSAPRITAPAVRTDKVKVTDRLITNFVTNSNLEISPTGIVVFNSNRVNVNGNLHATGNLTYDGNIIFGDSSNDAVTFNADITSNITPDVSNTYDLGSLTKQWDDVYSPVITATNITTSAITIGGINLLETPGKTVYVSVNGSDTNYGNHAHSTYASLKKALQVATSGDTVIIFPGTYTEIFPLLVPQGVTIKGYGIRAVKIQPTEATKSNDAFLLNGDSTVEFLTVANFFYNSLTNTGHAFRFAPGFKTLSRSPYIQNVTVKTQGSVVTSSDPYGFNSADAGAGVYADGAVVDSSGVIPPTMLFFSATFITPNQDAITALNGVRIEWLNSFSYFARRGLYLKNGTAGRASQGLVFGAELRSINSANIYGTYGAVADGNSTLAYLIGHNFGYVGSGKDSSNDPKLAVQSQEIERYNDGEIYFETTDHLGDIRVGDIFYVSQETGQIAFDAQSISVLAGGNITLESATSTTIIDPLGVQTGNIRIHDNTIRSLIGPVNIKANNGASTTYLNTDVSVTGSVTTTGDTTIKGNVYFGSDNTDQINFVSYFTQNFNPNTNNYLNLGSDSKRWKNLFVGLIDVDGVTRITNNTFTTLTTNTDLIFSAAGTGKIQIPSNNVRINNNLITNGVFTVNGATSLRNVEITGPSNITLTGDLNQTGNTYITGTFGNADIQITGDSYFQVPNIRIYNNVISNQVSGNDLIFSANGTGGINIEKLTVTDRTIANTWVSPSTDAQKSILLTPSGTGNVVINTNKALKIPVGSNVNRTPKLPGAIRYNNSYNRYEGYVPNGLVSLNQIYSYNSSNATFALLIPSFVVLVQTSTTTIGLYTINVLDATGLVVGYRVVSGPGVAAGARITDITGNVVTLDAPNVASLTGTVTFGDCILEFTLISGVQVGQAVTGTGIQPGTVVVSSTTTTVVLSKPISSTLTAGSTITLGAMSSTFVTPELTPGAADNTIRFGISGSTVATITSASVFTNVWNISNVVLNGNIIENLNDNLYLDPDSGTTNINNISFYNSEISNNTNSAITLAATGPGYVKFGGTGAVVFPFGDTAERRIDPELGELRFNNELGFLEVYNATDWIPALGTSGAATEQVVNDTMQLWSIILG